MLPYLYRHVILNVSMLEKDRAVISTADNPGLSHVHTLRIMDTPYVQVFDNEKHLPSLLQLLARLPMNSLRVFESVIIISHAKGAELIVCLRLRTKNAVHQDLGLLLRIRQRRLRNHQYHSLPSTARSLTPTFDEIGHISCLQVLLRNGRDCDIAGQLYSHMPLVKNMTITLNDDRLDGTMGGKGETGRGVIDKIFGSPDTSHARAKIRNLRLEGMSLKSAAVILPALLPLDELEHLHLLRCRYTSRFCESLAELNLCLKAFCDQQAYNVRSPGTMDAFLNSLRCLRTLRLSRDWRSSSDFESCDWPSLLPCASELLSLDLDDHEPGPDGVLFLDTRRSLPGFRVFCDRASQLQQLAMRSPGLEETHWNAPHGLKAFLVKLTLRTCKL
jgi:hypothetical protein